MITVITGDKGSGKTKRLLDMANEAISTESGYVVFIDDDKRYMYDLKHEVRFVDASEYTAIKNCTSDAFFGFVSGMLSVNFDITLICIDAFLKLVSKTPVEEMESLFEHLEALSEHSNVSFIITLNKPTEELPHFVKKYVTE